MEDLGGDEEEAGGEGTEGNGSPVIPWHDVSLASTGWYNALVG